MKWLRALKLARLLVTWQMNSKLQDTGLIKLLKKRVSEETYQRQKQENDEFSYYLSVRNLGFQTDRRQNLKEQEESNDKFKTDRS